MLEHLLRILILFVGIGFAVVLGNFRPEWKSRKTLISWTWTIAVIDMIVMSPEFAQSSSGQILISGAIALNIINFIGDRIENIKMNGFSASLRHEETQTEKLINLKRSKEKVDKNEKKVENSKEQKLPPQGGSGIPTKGEE